MNQLVSYAETSSEDEDKCSNNFDHIFVKRKHRPNSDQELAQVEQDRKNDVADSRKLSQYTSQNHYADQHLSDLPITDESDDQSGGLIKIDSYQKHLNKLSKSKVLNVKLIPQEHHLESGTDYNLFPSYPPLNIDGALQQIVNHNSQNQVTDNIQLVLPHKSIQHQRPCSDDQESLISFSKEIPTVLCPTNTHNIDKIFATSHLLLNSNDNLTDAVLVPQSVQLESTSRSVLNRKRKLSCDSGKQLNVPDSIRSMFHDKQQRWVDEPAKHDNRNRSFPHLEGNWATHVFIPVPKTDAFVGFVDDLLELLMPQTFQALPDFHVSLSRTVTIRYHWIESLVDSLRENLRSLKSCVSDLTSVKLFTNDEKTRTFVSIELCQDDREFVDFVKAVDKSFAEFKLPEYYKNPSFHISVGWCLENAVERISAEKLLKAQEMLGEFVAANPDLSFVYAHKICCQTGCKSFVIPLQESDG